MLRVDLDVELALLALAFHRPGYYCAWTRRTRCVTSSSRSASFFTALTGGAVAFGLTLHEGVLEALYRATVTISLTGIDTKPDSTGGEVITIVLILAGMAIYGYLASAIVELIAHGVLTGAVAERRRRRMIERTSDHYIICGYGRVGREVAAEFHDARVPFVVLDLNPQVLDDRPRSRRPLHRRHGDEGRGPARGRARARPGPRRLLRLRRRQPVHHALRPRPAAPTC